MKACAQIAVLGSALLLSPEQVKQLDKAWQICQEQTGFAQCRQVYEAERERVVVREAAAAKIKQEQEDRVSKFLDSVVEMLK